MMKRVKKRCLYFSPETGSGTDSSPEEESKLFVIEVRDPFLMSPDTRKPRSKPVLRTIIYGIAWHNLKTSFRFAGSSPQPI